MLAVEISQCGPAEGLRLTQRPVPVPGEGEVLLRVAASGVNRPDVLQRRGLYAPPPGVSDLPGLEVAGVVEAGHAEALHAAGLEPGQRVCALLAGGGYAQWCVAPVGQVLPVPEGLSDVQAASLPETLFTVWQNLVLNARLQANDTVLVHGGSSGIGVAAIQVARALGARVLVTVGTEAKAQACLALGAELAINHRTQDFVALALEATQGRGVDVVLDMVGGDYVNRNLRCLAPDGRLALIAAQGGTQAQVDVGLLLSKRLSMVGSTLRPRSLAYKAELARQLRHTVWPWLASGRVKPVIDRVFAAQHPLGAVQAHQTMEAGAHVGKLVLDWTLPAAA